MPTTTNKDIKSNSMTNSSAAPLQEPQKLVQNLVDKKIRNLEKRKSRLQELRDSAAKGQKLEPEQEDAIKKLDQVVEMIDMMKELNKSIADVLMENTKQQKKIAKKEMLDKQIENKQQELERLKTIIQFQDIIGRFKTMGVRQDFIKGTNGAMKLSEDQLNQLDKLFDITANGRTVESKVDQLFALAEGKSREVCKGMTFQQLKELLLSIVETKYFNRETNISTTPQTTTTNHSIKPNVVQTATKADESVKNETINSKSQSGPNQYHSIPNNEFNSSLNQIQSQFASGISFMTRDSLDKDPAVVAVASVNSSYPYHSYGLQTNDSLINSIPDSNISSINPQKSSNYDNTSSMSTIPTQTFTNQQFAALIPGTPSAGAVFSAVPVTLAPVQMTGMVTHDLSGQVTTDLIGSQPYANQQNFMNSSATDKHPIASHERGNTFNSDENFRNNRNNRGNRPEGQRNKHLNGSQNRPRNPNKGQGFQNPNQMFTTFNPKQFDNNMNGGSTFGTFNDNKNNFQGNRGRPQQPRPQRTQENSRQPRTNQNYNPNFGPTAANK